MAIQRKHILLLNYPHFGHIIPLLELGKRLAKYHNVTFAVSEAQTDDIKKRNLITEDFPASFRLHALQDGLDHARCILVAAIDGVQQLEYAVSSGLIALLDSISTRSSSLDAIDVVILDYFLHHGASVCRDRQLPYYYFDSASAGLTLAVLAMTEETPCDPEKDTTVAGFFEKPGSSGAASTVSAAKKDLFLAMKRTFPQAKGVIYNSAREMDAHALQLIEKHPLMNGQNLFFVGPLIPEEKKSTEQQRESPVLAWLDAQKNATVVYVSFGSLVYPDSDELYQLGLALLALKRPFILSLPVHLQAHLPRELQDASPSDAKQEFHVVAWAPQKQILQHPAVAVFVSHCGWNSTIESLYCGMPVVGWPLFADQKINATWLRDNGVGKMIEGTGLAKERLVPAGEIAAIISQVADLEGQVAYRKAAIKWRDIPTRAASPDGSSGKDFLSLLEL